LTSDCDGDLEERKEIPRGDVVSARYAIAESDMSAFVEQLLTKSRTELDALFSAHEAGPIPDGFAEGTAIMAPGSSLNGAIAGLMKVFVWKGKAFDATSGTLRNRILPFGIAGVPAKVYRAPSWLDQRECIVLDYAETSIVARWIRDEIRLVAPDVYLGRAYWRKARLMDFVLELKPGAR